MKTPLLLLHGALGAATQFKPLKELLSARFEIHAPDFSGHGEAGGEHPFSIALFAADVLRYLDERKIAKIAVFGYSMGGYVALYLARHYPERISRIITLATKLHWDEPTAAKETGMLDTARIEAKVPQLASSLQERHIGKDWKMVVNKTAAMLTEMGADSPLKTPDFAAIQTPVILLLGDRDKMVSLEETVATYKLLPNGKMGILPGTPHPFEQADLHLLSIFIEHFNTTGID